MWSLAPGLIVNLFDRSSELRNVATGQRWPLRLEDHALVTALSTGVPETSAGDYPGLQTAAQLGWAVQTESTEDRFLLDRLRRLDNRFRWAAPDGHDPLAERLRRIHASRRQFYRGFGQYAALPETVLRRVLLAGRESAKRILVMGDDDFVSLGLAELGHDVTVVEIDPSITTLLERFAPPTARMRILTHDLREPWPAELLGSFDLFYCDPLSGPFALRLFALRGLAALRPGGRGYLCVAEIGHKSFETVRRDCGFDVREHYSDFNHYYGPVFELAHYVSDLVTVAVNDTTELKPAGHERFYSPGLVIEEQFSTLPASRYVMENIDTRLAELIHIDTAIQVLKTSGQLDLAFEELAVADGLRSWVALTHDHCALHLRVDLNAKNAELFVSPAAPDIEDSLLACLFGLFKVEGSVIQRHRVRNSTLLRLA